ncbi:Hypothetical protein, putative [Bodo saltans]|uniref:Uncharacterized protein n=1 Tax=Bodo saltans TaxID=75058 RepID=A0A0S4JB22_BODSA|nr:Hypothetical protein, putative [Bodo saltans]|eukprot:CUG87459.1 Hypothetical protein, putative [Bodo saltans]
MYLQVGTGGGGGDENASASDATEFSDDRPFTPSTPTHTFQNVSNASLSSLGVALVGSSSNVQHRPLLPQNIPHRLQQARQTSLLTANVVGKFHHPR